MSRSPMSAAGRLGVALVISVLVTACGAAAAPEGSPAPSQQPLPGGSDAPGPAAHSDAPRNSAAPGALPSGAPESSSDGSPPPGEPDPGSIGGPDEVGATITVDGMTWWFEVELGFPLDCIVAGEGTHIVANGRVGGHLDGIGFAADLSPEGGWLEVDDPTTGEHWMARADREGMTVLHEVPEGSSQIDTVAVESGRASGTATFIETRAYRDAWLNNGTYPAPVFGTFVIRCPRS